MPRERYHCVSLRDEPYERLMRAARAGLRSVPKQIEYMLDQLYPENGGGGPVAE